MLRGPSTWALRRATPAVRHQKHRKRGGCRETKQSHPRVRRTNVIITTSSSPRVHSITALSAFKHMLGAVFRMIDSWTRKRRATAAATVVSWCTNPGRLPSPPTAGQDHHVGVCRGCSAAEKTKFFNFAIRFFN